MNSNSSPKPPSEAPSFGRLLRNTTIVHVAVFGAVVLIGFLSTIDWNKEPKEITVDFTVAVPPPATPTPEPPKAEPTPPKAEPTPPPPPPPQPAEVKPAADPDAIPVVKEKPKPTKKPIEVSKTIVQRAPTPQPQPPKVVTPPKVIAPPQPVKPTPIVAPTRPKDVTVPNATPLSDEEIRKMLAAGAKPAATTSIPADETARCQALIQEQLKLRWIRPDASALTGRGPRIQFSLGMGGTVSNVSLVSSSGNKVLDESALNATRAVHQFNYLSPAYIRANPTVTITFDLKQ